MLIDNAKLIGWVKWIQTTGFSEKTLSILDAVAKSALVSLRNIIQNTDDPVVRAELQSALDMLEERAEFDPPRLEARLGPTQVLPWLFLGGEHDADEALLKVDVWIDFRNGTGKPSQRERNIFVPERVTIVRMPFADGDLHAVRSVLPLAKVLVEQYKDEGKTVFVSCRAGVSRSAVLALWVMAEEMGYDAAWKRLLLLRPWVRPDDAFEPFLEEIRRQTL